MVPSAITAAAVAALALAPASPPSPAAAVRGTYRLQGTAHVAASPLHRDEEVHADAVLRPGAGPRDVRVHIAAEGQSCDLDARIGDGGALAFPEGQRCAFDLRSPEARGRIEARLRSATGRAQGGSFALEMAWTVSGTVSLRAGSVLGVGLDLPSRWSPDVPIRGEARARAEGRRDASRAAQE